MIRSILKGRKSICIVNGVKSNVTDTLSGPYQGAPPSATIWRVTVNPLLISIERDDVLYRSETNKTIIGRIIPFCLMDDINVITKWYRFEYNKTRLISRDNQKRMTQLLQKAMNKIERYLSINNIPMNEDKTQIITFNEIGYKNDGNNSNNINRQNRNQILMTDYNDNTEEYNNYKNDKWYKFRKTEMKVMGVTKKSSESFVLLGNEFDNMWTFELQIRNVIAKMRLIRMKLYNLISSNKNSLNMDVIHTVIKQSSQALLNYCGPIYLNQKADLGKLQKEWNKTIRITCSGGQLHHHFKQDRILMPYLHWKRFTTN